MINVYITCRDGDTITSVSPYNKAEEWERDLNDDRNTWVTIGNVIIRKVDVEHVEWRECDVE